MLSHRTVRRTAALTACILAALSSPAAASGLLPTPEGSARSDKTTATLAEPRAAIFTESFGQNLGNTPTPLTDYVAAPPLNETYTADPYWLDLANCNGIIINYAADSGQCGGRRSANALGQIGGANPTTNHALTSGTNSGPVPADGTVIETQIPIPLTSTNRYLELQVDVAATACNTVGPELKLYLLDGTQEIPAFTTPINPCTDPKARIFVVDMQPVSARTYTSLPVFFTGSSVGFRIRNGQTAAQGNDFGIDNIRIVAKTNNKEKGKGTSKAP
ncbi:hypothetical protein ACTVZO_39750 [Streptomyces sp. IBSNAI002]|uniref:hypothetical protein n=1 Tax=Streptomyces sp. IBSNAI002 TaxID=3457500 RepID=UPI003FD485DE